MKSCAGSLVKLLLCNNGGNACLQTHTWLDHNHPELQVQPGCFKPKQPNCSCIQDRLGWQHNAACTLGKCCFVRSSSIVQGNSGWKYVEAPEACAIMSQDAWKPSYMHELQMKHLLFQRRLDPTICSIWAGHGRKHQASHGD